MKILTVLPFKKGILKNDLTYFSAGAVEKGAIVEVPIRGKKTLGLVISVAEASKQKTILKEMPFKLKKISGLKEKSFWKEEFLDSVLATAKYFLAGKSAVCASLIPSVFKEHYDTFSKISLPISQTLKNNSEIRAEKLLFQAPLEDRLSFYKTLIRSSFAEKKSVFMVFPSEKDLNDFKESLSRGIENFTFSLHSGRPVKKLLTEIEKIVLLPHPVLILGTAPFLSVPRNDLGTIVLEHENNPAYKTFRPPFLDFRVFVEIFAQKNKVRFILASSLLRFESLIKKDTFGWSKIQSLSFRSDFQGKIVIFDKKDSTEFKILKENTLWAIQEALEQKKNVFVFSLRKGLATYTICRDCQEVLLCDRCQAPVVLYTSKDKEKRMFVCNRCHLEKDPNTLCPKCGSWNLLPLGIGTETVFEALKKHFGSKNKSLKLFRLDKESAKTEKQAEKIVAEFEKNAGAILVGTELALFYLTKKVPISVIASFDSLWSIPNFKMGEKIIQIIFSLLSKTEKTLFIETKNEKDPGILAIKNDTLLFFAKEELAERKKLGYPPYLRFIKITFRGNKEKTLEAKNFLKERLKEYEPEIFSGFVPKIKNQYILNALLKIPLENWSLPELLPETSILENLFNLLSSLPPQFNVLVDPEDLL